MNDERRTMIKKLLVLSLVLGIASLATAALSMSVQGTAKAGSTFDVVISGTVPGDFGYYRFYDVFESSGVGANAGNFTGVVAYGKNANNFNAAGNLSGVFSYDAGFDGIEMTLDDLDDEVGAGLNDPLSGQWVTLQISGVVAGAMTIGMYDASYSNYTTLGVIEIAEIPEPATLALLGLGALVLRKRK